MTRHLEAPVTRRRSQFALVAAVAVALAACAGPGGTAPSSDGPAPSGGASVAVPETPEGSVTPVALVGIVLYLVVVLLERRLVGVR